MSQAIDRINSLIDRAEAINTDIARKTKELRTATENKKLLDDAIALVSAAIEKSVDSKQYIEAVVNQWIKPMYDTEKDSYEFKFDVVSKKKDGTISGYKPSVYRNGKPERQGEAMVNIISFVLRDIFLELSDTEPVGIFDEPLTNVSSKKFELIFDNLKRRQESKPTQRIIVTHQTNTEFPHEIKL